MSNYYRGNKAYAPNIINDLMRYLRQCGICRQPATREAMGLIIVGNPPLRCDDCSPPPGLEVRDIPEAELARACEDYLRTHAVG